MRPYISVIMPIYNAEKTIKKAIKSVLNQTYNNFELILVDDGSNDKSLEICQYMATLDKRIRVYHKNNEGICATRNKGIALAYGKYIIFIDDDDTFDADLIRDNVFLAEKYDADFVKYGSASSIVDSSTVISNNHGIFENTACLIQPQKKFYDLFKNHMLVYIWDMIIKKEFITNNKLQFDVKFKHGHEDILFSMQALKNARIIVINPRNYYTHFVGGNTTSNKFFYEQIQATLYLLIHEKNILKDMNIEKKIISDVIATRFLYLCQYMSREDNGMSYKEIKTSLQEFHSINNCNICGDCEKKGIKKFAVYTIELLYNLKLLGMISFITVGKRLVLKYLKKYRAFY